MRYREAVDSFLMSREGKNCSRKTILWYEWMLRKFHKFLKENEINFDKCTVTTLRMYLRYLSRDQMYSDRYILGHYRVLKAFYNYLIREGLINENPTANLEKPKVEKKLLPILSQNQVKLILAQPNKETFEGYRNFVMIKVLYETGIRLGELLNLQLDHVSIEGGYMRVFGKGNKERFVFMGVKLRQELHRYLLKRKDIASSHLFITRYGFPVDNRSFQTALTEYGKKAGIKGVRVSPHTFRHTFATEFLKREGNLKDLKELLGHRDFETVEIYLTLDNEHLKKAFQKRSPLDNL
jgi:integrase/recombinase XerD